MTPQNRFWKDADGRVHRVKTEPCGPSHFVITFYNNANRSRIMKMGRIYSVAQAVRVRVSRNEVWER